MPTSSRSLDSVNKKLPWGVRDSRKIGEEAARICRTNLQKRGWSSNSSASIAPTYSRGQVGLKSSIKYVVYQNKGTKPFLMTWVEGRIVPIGGKNGGTPHFVRGKDVGKPGWVTLPGGVKRWRDQKWRHPGLTPQHFMEQALDEAIRKHRPTMKKRLISVLMGEYHGDDDRR